VSAKVKVLIVDDHPIVREGLAARLSIRPELEICGEAEDVDEALALLDELEPELMIVDLSLRGGHGLDLIKKTKRRRPNTKMLVISAHAPARSAISTSRKRRRKCSMPSRRRCAASAT
jgi:DNA-binding NarL/FixJ family response regulator